jgi:hypothetical protein
MAVPFAVTAGGGAAGGFGGGCYRLCAFTLHLSEQFAHLTAELGVLALQFLEALFDALGRRRGKSDGREGEGQKDR